MVLECEHHELIQFSFFSRFCLRVDGDSDFIFRNDEIGHVFQRDFLVVAFQYADEIVFRDEPIRTGTGFSVMLCEQAVRFSVRCLGVFFHQHKRRRILFVIFFLDHLHVKRHGKIRFPLMFDERSEHFELAVACRRPHPFFHRFVFAVSKIGEIGMVVNVCASQRAVNRRRRGEREGVSHVVLPGLEVAVVAERKRVDWF